MTFNNYNIQTIDPYKSFIFEKNNNLSSAYHQEQTSNIKILDDGFYVINIILYLEENGGTVAFFKNNKIIERTISKSNPGTHIVFVHELIYLKENDEITLKNYSENKIILNNKHHKINLDFIISKVS